MDLLYSPGCRRNLNALAAFVRAREAARGHSDPATAVRGVLTSSPPYVLETLRDLVEKGRGSHRHAHRQVSSFAPPHPIVRALAGFRLPGPGVFEFEDQIQARLERALAHVDAEAFAALDALLGELVD